MSGTPVTPNQNKLYTINFVSDYFSNAELKLSLKENNTLSSLELNADSQLDKSLAQLGTTTQNIANAMLDIEQQRRSKELAEKKEEVAATKTSQSSLEAAQNAIIDVKKAEKALQDQKALPIATAEDIAIKEAELILAKIKANHAYQNAGLPIPFPGVSP